MTSIVYNKTLKEPLLDKAEALRYAGAREGDEIAEALFDECCARLLPTLSYRACYRIFDIDEPHIASMLKDSVKLREALSGCDSVIILAATVGIGPDRLMMSAKVTSPARALIYQAIGAERVEALCDALCSELSLELGAALTRRFSPGYGDFDLKWQREIFSLLDCERQIGLTLGDSLLMSPTKSVTAIIGVIKGGK